MIEDKIDIALAQSDISRMGWSLCLGSRCPTGVFLVSNAELSLIKPGEMAAPSPFILTDDAIQSLMDNLWAGGVRPTNNRDTQHETEYLRRQLERAVAWAFPNKGEKS